jgi:formate--tetrahydrofolate ligase
VRRTRNRSDGNLILVTAINPTPAGEGKTTTTVGLGDGLNRHRQEGHDLHSRSLARAELRHEGRRCGWRHGAVVPMEDMNLHFTGDFHAITGSQPAVGDDRQPHLLGQRTGHRPAPHRLAPGGGHERPCAAPDHRAQLGGVANGFPRQTGFDITVASEVMAILCLAKDLADLEERLGKIVVAYRRDRRRSTAATSRRTGAMTVLLKDAMQPNMVQTLENNPAFVHGGPFANIAHGCNSVVATTTALKLCDYVVTEAGFGADLGAEKFLTSSAARLACRPMRR